jgi:hypothetical protein
VIAEELKVALKAIIHSELEPVRNDVAYVRLEVETLKKRASFWGAVGGSLTALATSIVHLSGCL